MTEKNALLSSAARQRGSRHRAFCQAYYVWRSSRNLIVALVFFVAVVLSQSAGANVVTEVFGLESHNGKQVKLIGDLVDNFPVTSIAWSPNGHWIATASTQRRIVHVWDVPKKSIIRELTIGAPSAQFHSLWWSKNSNYLAACDGLGAIARFYNSTDWAEVKSFDTKAAQGCLGIAFSDDETRIAILGQSLVIIDTATGRAITVIALNTDFYRSNKVKSVEFVPQSHSLWLGGYEWTYLVYDGKELPVQSGRIWRLAENEAEPRFKIDAYPTVTSAKVISLAVRDDGEQLATGTTTGVGPVGSQQKMSVHIFRASDGELVASPLDGQTEFGQQTALAYSRRGRLLLVGHADTNSKAIHIIDTHSNKVIDMVRSGDAVLDIAADASSEQFAATSGSRVLIWSFSSLK